MQDVVILGPYHTSGRGRALRLLVGRAVGGLTPRPAGISAGVWPVSWPRQEFLPGAWACLSGKIARLVEGPTEIDATWTPGAEHPQTAATSSNEVDFISRFRVSQQVSESFLIPAHRLRYLADTTNKIVQALLKAGPKAFTFLFCFFLIYSYHFRSFLGAPC